MKSGKAKRIAVFGGTGATGKVLVDLAMQRGWLINALVREDSHLEQAEGLQIVRGSFDDTQAVDAVITACDAVICVIGPRPPFNDVFCAGATREIIHSMQRNQINRLICQTGAMIGYYEQNRTTPFQWMTNSVQKKYPAMMADRMKQEQLVKSSALDWCIIKPSRLTLGKSRNRVRAGTDLRLGMMSKISRQDLASFLLQQVVSNDCSQQVVFVRG